MPHDMPSILPSQLALITLAHVAKYPFTPNLHHRAVLVTHLLRAYSRTETEYGKDIIHPDGPLGLKETSKVLQSFQKTSAGNTDGEEWKDQVAGYIDQCRSVLASAVRHAYLRGATSSGEAGTAGLAFIFQMEAADKRKEYQIKKIEPHTNPFLTLAIAREVLFDIDRTVADKYGKNLTDNIEFEPIHNVKKFRDQMRNDYPFDADVLKAPPEKIEECVKVLCDLACKLDVFQRSLYNAHSMAPYCNEEGVSLRMLRDYLAPYKQGREKTIESQSQNAQKTVADVIDFTARADQLRHKRGGIIRRLPEPV